MAYGRKPAPETPTPEKERQQRTKQRAVLSRKARERSALLKKASRELIDSSQKLISESYERDKRPR